jgi:hypothetical protein
MAYDQTRIFDGFTSLEGGMDAGSATTLIPRNKYFFGMNVTGRGGYIKNRPPWNEYPMVFVDNPTQVAYKSGRFQGGDWYIPDDGFPIGLVSISGHIYSLTVSDQEIQVADITPSGDANMSTLPLVWMCQADSFMVIQNGVDAPFVFDGNTLRRSQQGQDPNAKPGVLAANQYAYYEVPTGTAMAYGQGRLWLVRGRNWEAGDILDAAIANSAIRFSEVVLYQDSFSVPPSAGNVTAILFNAETDTSLGQGQLQVHTESGFVATLNITPERSSWATQTNPPLQTVALMGGGAVTQAATAIVNDDVWYRSRDGIRSFVVGRREFGTWGNTPQSREVNSIVNFDSDGLIQFASACWFDNRFLVTISPQQTGNNIYFQGLIALDFDMLSSLNDAVSLYMMPRGFAQATAKPGYDGVWAGLNISKITRTIFNGVERCFLFVNDPASGNTVWELEPTDPTGQANPFDNGNCPIASYFETGSYDFGDKTKLKKLIAGDLWIDQLRGTTNFNFSWLPEQYPFWLPWQSFTESDGGLCFTTNPLTNSITCEIPVTVPLQYRSRLRLQEPDFQPDNIEVDYPFNVGYDHRFRIAWTGQARLKGFRVHAYTLEDETTGRQPS